MRKSLLDAIGIIFGLAAVIIVVVSLLLILNQQLLPHWGIWSDEFGARFGAGRQQESGEESIREAIESVQVANVAGRVTVSGWEKDYVLVKWAKTSRWRRALANLEAVIEVRGKSLTVRRVSKRPSGIRGSIAFEIFLPGNVRDLAVKSVSGKVSIRDVSPELNQKLETVSGSIETDNAADLDASSISGSVDFVFSGERLRIKTISGRIEGRVEPMVSGGSIKITSVSGSVDLEVPSTLDAAVNLHSLSGSVSSELSMSVTESKRNRLRGTAGDGTIPFEVGTTSGSIEINTKEI